MQLFYLFNGWAGRNAWLDAAMRFFYVGAVPLLATVLVAILLFRPPTRIPTIAPSNQANSSAATASASNTWRVALATVLSVLLCLLSMAAINAFAQRWLHTDMLSPRPFVTHRVNALLTEPNDNSFPSPEIMLAACLATAMWAIFPRGGALSWMVVALLGFARLFCGTNYPVDIAAGAILGWAWSALALALCRVRLPIPARDEQFLIWRARRQALVAVSTIAVLTLLVGVDLLRTPRYALKMQMLWSAPWNLSPVAAYQNNTNPAQIEQEKSAGGTTTHEGEGVAMAPEADLTAASPRFGRHYGRQAQAEAHLSKVLSRLAVPHSIIDVEVAQVRVGNSAYRAAMVRFAVQHGRAGERQLVAQTATTLVKSIFHADATIQNVDVLAVVKRSTVTPATIGLEANGASPSSATSASTGWVWTPAFSASIQRRNLRILNGPQWANAPGVDSGLWLRARSRLYIDTHVLSATAPRPTQIPTALPPTPMPTPLSTPLSTPTKPPRILVPPTATRARRRVLRVAPSEPQSTLGRSHSSAHSRVPKPKVRPTPRKSTAVRRSSYTLRRMRTSTYRSRRRYRTRRLRRRY